MGFNSGFKGLTARPTAFTATNWVNVSPCNNFTPYVTYLLTYILTYLLTYLLTPCSGVLLEKLSNYQLAQKFLTFNRTRKFIAPFTRARHLSLSWARSIQSMTPHLTSWRSILKYLPIYIWIFQLVSFLQIFPPKHLSSPPYVLNAPPISFFPIRSETPYFLWHWV